MHRSDDREYMFPVHQKKHNLLMLADYLTAGLQTITIP